MEDQNQYCIKGRRVVVLMRNNMIFKGKALEWDQCATNGCVLELTSGNIIILNPSDVFVIKVLLHEERNEEADTDPAPAPHPAEEIMKHEDVQAFEAMDAGNEFEYPERMQQEDGGDENMVEKDADDVEAKLKLRAKDLAELHVEKARVEREIIARKLKSLEARGIMENNYDIPRKLYDKEPSALIRSRKKNK